MTAMMHLEVLTPDKKVLAATVNSMRVLLPDGWWGILAGHAPMISFIHSGVVHYRVGEITRYIALYKGTIEVKQKPQEITQVLILTAAAEEGADLEAVKANLEQQAARLAKQAKEAELEFNQIRLSLEKSLQKADITQSGL